MTEPDGGIGELFASCHPQLTRWLTRLVSDDEVAQDIAAEAFVRLINRWSRLDNPRSYLYMIAANLVHDHWRRTCRERSAMIKIAVLRTEPVPSRETEQADLEALIDLLPQQWRAAFLLHHCAGYPVREIASMLGKAEGTIKSDLFHARSRLRADLVGTAA